MSPVRVLWLSRTMPLPPSAGDVNYTRLLSGALAQAGADVTFMALVSEEKELSLYRRACPGIRWMPIEASPRPDLPSVLSTMPFQAARYATDIFRATLRDELARSQYDCVVLDYYALGWALDELRKGPAKAPCLVYISHNFETEVTAAIARDFRGNLAKKILLYANAWKTARIERRLAQSVDIVTVNTDEDGVQYLRKLGAKRPPITLPPGFSGKRRTARDIDASVPRRVVVLGSYQWIAKQMNLETFLNAADDAFARAGIEVQVVGAIGDDFKARWEGRLKATKFMGFVDDLQACLDQARMGLVIEVTGGGFKHKTLDYVFARLPVGALSQAIVGMDDTMRRHFLVEDRLDALVASIIGAIDDFGRLNAMQEGAFAAAHDRFEWGANGRLMLRGIEETIARSAAE